MKNLKAELLASLSPSQQAFLKELADPHRYPITSERQAVCKNYVELVTAPDYWEKGSQQLAHLNWVSAQAQAQMQGTDAA